MAVGANAPMDEAMARNNLTPEVDNSHHGVDGNATIDPGGVVDTAKTPACAYC